MNENTQRLLAIIDRIRLIAPGPSWQQTLADIRRLPEK